MTNTSDAKRFSDVQDWTVRATAEAMVRLLEHSAKVGLSNTEEFTFRAVFMAATHDLFPQAIFQTEWKKFDLLAVVSHEPTLIEFKYYLTRRTYSVDGEPLNYKGGAGPGNEKEFWRCVKKLRQDAPSTIQRRRLVLVYERETPRDSKHSFHRSYSNLSERPELHRVIPISVGPLEARVIVLGASAESLTGAVSCASDPGKAARHRS